MDESSSAGPPRPADRIQTGHRSTTAELVYGEPLRLPADLVTDRDDDRIADPADYVDQFKSAMQLLHAAPPRSPLESRRAFVHEDLRTCSHAFLRHAVHNPLVAPYDGPYEVVKRDDKRFVLRINGQDNCVTIDRLKPAFLEARSGPPDPDSVTPTDSPFQPLQLRSGRRVMFTS